MKYIIALIASAGVIVFWAVLSALVGWKRGGGFVGVMFMWTIVAGIWGIIMARFADKHPLAKDTSCHMNSTDPTLPTNQNDDNAYEQALKEIETNDVKKGLWAKVLTKEPDSENRRNALYIELRVRQILLDTPVFIADEKFSIGNDDECAECAIFNCPSCGARNLHNILNSNSTCVCTKCGQSILLDLEKAKCALDPGAFDVYGILVKKGAYECPHCFGELTSIRKESGKLVHCPECGKPIKIPVF